MATKSRRAAVKRYSPPRNTKRATYWYIPSTPTELEKRSTPARRAESALNTSRPLGTSTYVYNPTNPERSRTAEDVSVIVRVPSSNPTEGGGLVTAATTGQVICDSGPLAAGTYYVEVFMGASGVGAAGKHLSLEHRNAANGATLFTRGICPYGGSVSFVKERVVVALNERIRVIQSGVAGGAGEIAHGTVRCYLLAA